MLLQWAEDDDSEYDESAEHVETSHGRRKRSLVTVDTFHSYVRPTWRPQLSEFCISLTGIQQVRRRRRLLKFRDQLTAGDGGRLTDVPRGPGEV